MESRPELKTRLALAGLLLNLLLAAVSLAGEAGTGPTDDTPNDTATAEAALAPRPRIGLVLGGGGARGGAHIGVLQVLQEMNVPIDYVVGTSMGAVIGALHAVGFSPGEIEATVTDVDWDDLFSDRPERLHRTFRRKQDDTANFLPLEWGWKGGVVLASGAISGQKLGFAFRSPALYLAGHDGFDSLGTPFRAVSTDLQTGEMFVPDHGNLLKAVRASMSIPGVFPPVNWDGRLLVDGYLARNLPVDVALDLGADIIIAVDVGALPAETDPEKLHTIVGISEQKGHISARQNVDPMLDLAQIVIQPDLKGISTRDFKRIAETITPGREATLQVAEQLRALSLPPAAYVTHARRHHPAPLPPLTVTAIELDNRSPAADRAVLAAIHQPLGQELDLDLLKADLTAIYDFGVFELVDFTLVHRPDGYVLRIIATGKYYAPHILNFGLSYRGGEGGVSEVTARLRWTRAELNALGGETRTEVQLGGLSILQSEMYQPLTLSRRPFVAVTGRWEYGRHPFYFQLKEWGNYNVEKLEIAPDLGLRLGHFGEARVGLLYGRVRASDRTSLNLAEFDGARGGYTAHLAFDMLNRPVLPYRGWGGSVSYFRGRPEFGSGLDYHMMSGAAGLALGTPGDIAHFAVRGGTDMRSGLPLYDVFTIGGLGQISGLQEDQLAGEVFGLATASYYHRLSAGANPYATSWYVGVQFEAGNAWFRFEDPGLEKLQYSGLVSLIGTTFAGPLSLSYGRTEDGHDAVYLGLGLIHRFLD